MGPLLGLAPAAASALTPAAGAAVTGAATAPLAMAALPAAAATVPPAVSAGARLSTILGNVTKVGSIGSSLKTMFGGGPEPESPIGPSDITPREGPGVFQPTAPAVAQTLPPPKASLSSDPDSDIMERLRRMLG